ncbi:MAG: hypothetical protein KKB82_06415 [Candidatus Omnitrophica bacterium]|nr:hypothetical protein [Candidatus Omnitrophota bacterium]MBU1925536.1 hypothetical protein [Candidatus Omnitrophota bacterium]
MWKPSRTKSIKFDLDELKIRGQKDIVALGAELKANFCIIKKNKAYLYYGFGDLKDPRCWERFRAAVLQKIKRFKIKPAVISCDLNPQFLSSQFAQELKLRFKSAKRLLPVQHHYAHIAGAQAALALSRKKIIGVACDGTGLGDNKNVWGCEFLLCDHFRIRRIGHLNYIPLPGADMAVRQPWRVAIALLYKLYGKEIFTLPIEWLKKKKAKTKVLIKMIDKGINTPLASSAGRLFDAVAALTGLCHDVKYEAEAAIALERKAGKLRGREKSSYPFSIREENGLLIARTDMMIKAIVEDIRCGNRVEVVAARFHNTFSRIIIKMCGKIKDKFNIRDVVLGGGVFFNKIITDSLMRGLERSGFFVHKPKDCILSDEGLSLGQAVIAYVSGRTGKN